MKRLFLLISLFASHLSSGQTVLGTNAPSLHWNQIKTPHFRIVFPEGFEFQAQRMANTFEHIRDAESKSMGGSPRKISVILQNQSAVSNGFVSMFPKRSEFFTMPSQNYNFTGTNDWLDLLASHEYRHVVQYQNARRGLNKFLFYLFGYPAFASWAHIGAPDWFWEGDAVATETAFTPSGRGKIPNFGLVFRTNLVSGRIFNYHKQYLRSYKDNIPNHYVLGYYMVSYLRKRTNDPEIWQKISARSWKLPIIPFAFSNAINKKAGVRVRRLYNEMAKDLQSQWQKQIDSLVLTDYETVNSRSTRAYTDYLYPQPMPDGSVLALKEGIGDISTLVSLADGKEKKLFTPGFINDTGMLSATESAVVWNEFGYDPRWEVRTYSLVKAWNKKSGRRSILSPKRSRLAGAALSPDSRYVVTTESTSDYKHQVIVLTYPRGKVERIFENPQNYFYSMPRWSNDGDQIVVMKTTPEGKTISTIDVATGQEREILPVSQENVGYPVLYGDYLFFNSPLTGIDNVHVYDLKNKKRLLVTTSKFGAYNAAVSADGKFIYYNEQSSFGLDVVKVPFDPGLWKPLEVIEQADTYYAHLVEQENKPDLFQKIPANHYDVKRFEKWKHVFNPYSWGFFASNDLAFVDLGIISQDILSTTSVSAGYTYDSNEKTGFWRAGLSYQAWYPIIDVTSTSGKRSADEGEVSTLVITAQDSTIVTNELIFEWQEKNLSAGLRLPLTLTNGRYSSGLTLLNYFGMTDVTDFDNGFNDNRFFPAIVQDGKVVGVYNYYEYVGNGTLLYNYANLSAYRLLKRSRRDILSKWGQTINIKYYDTPYGGDYTGGVVSALGYLFFPGVFKHHSFYVYGTAQQFLNSPYNVDSQRDYYFRNTVPVPRGYSLARFQKYYGASVNYTLPIWYPDIAVGPVFNIQRFRLNVFADYGFGDTSYSYSHYSQSYTSVGGELKVDFNFMRMLPQIDVGVRFSYGIDPAVQKFELVIGTINF